MRTDKQSALKLRLSGHSYNEIQKYLGVPKSTLSNWFSEMVLGDAARMRINGRVREGLLNGLLKRNKRQTHIAHKRMKETRRSAGKQIGVLSHRELLLIGTALYWAEGYKRPIVRRGRALTSHAIGFTNADPLMISLFITFLTNVLEIPAGKIALYMRLYKHISEKNALTYWSRVTGMPKQHFRKTTYLISRSSEGKRPYNCLPYGTLNIVVGNTMKFHRIMGWIEGIAKCKKNSIIANDYRLGSSMVEHLPEYSSGRFVVKRK